MEGGFRDAPPLLPIVNDLQNASNTQTVNTNASGNTNIENSFVHLSLSDSNPQLYSGVSSDTVSINLATIEIPAIYHSPTSPDHPGYTPSVQNPVLFSSYKIPNRRELSKSLPFGLLFTPVAPLDPAPPCLHKPVISCFACNASINRYCKVDLNTGGWTCIFCKAENCHKNEYGTSSSTSLYPELVKFVVEYMDPSKQPFPIMGGLLDPIYIFVVDLSIPKPDIEKLKDSIVKTVKSVAKGTRIGFMTISNVVSIYQLNAPGIASCRVLPGIVTPDPSAIRQIIDYIENYFVPVENVWETIGNVFEAISSMLPNVKTVSPNAKRALGAAMETAVAMLTQEIKKEMKPLYSRIITFMSGSPNYGPGAIPDVGDTQTIEYHRAKAVSYYKEISLKAQEHDIGIDVFCIGLKQFNSNILQNLVLSNGGLVHMQKELLPEFSQNILMALSRTCGRQGSFEIRCSSSIVITHIIGSAVSDRKRSSEEETTSNNFFTMRMGGVQPKLCFTIHYELAEDIVDDFVYFQFIVNFINTQNQSITRVITRKIPTTGNFATFLSSVDQDVTSVLLAKSFVLKARKEPNITKINEQLDNELHQIAVKCGTAIVNKRVYKLPETLYKLPRSLFLTRRGPLLGVLIQHADDLDSLRCMFLNATLEDSKRIMEPKLYMAIDDPSQMYYEVPLENLAMQSDKVLLMDNQTDIFIWSGRETTAPEFNEKRENMHKLALELSKHRFPQPVIQQFKEGSSMARWFTCRLVPSHKDSPDEQIDAFPQLEELTQPQIAKLLSKFFKTDDLSYNQYCRTVLKL